MDFAKQQLDLMLTSVYLHPNGQIPAYEWNFSDVNPPVHACIAGTANRMRDRGNLEHHAPAVLKDARFESPRKSIAGHGGDGSRKL
jgi:hypothetical protein